MNVCLSLAFHIVWGFDDLKLTLVVKMSRVNCCEPHLSPEGSWDRLPTCLKSNEGTDGTFSWCYRVSNMTVIPKYHMIISRMYYVQVFVVNTIYDHVV